MDESGVEAKGIAPLKPELARIAAIATPADLARAIAQLSWDWLEPLPGGGSPVPPAPIATGVSVDAKHPHRYLPALGQGGIGLPDRDYFLIDNPGFVKTRAAYKTHLAAMFRLAGLDDADARAARVYALEERIARAHWTRQEQRDAEKRYNLWSRADFAIKAPGMDWDAFLKAAGFANEQTFLVPQPSAITGAAAAVGAVPLADWRDYLSYRVIRGFAPAGPSTLCRRISSSKTRPWPARLDCRCAGSGSADHRPGDGPCGGPHLSGQLFSAGGARPGAGHGRKHQGGDGRAAREPGLDGAPDQGPRPGQAGSGADRSGRAAALAYL